MHVYSLVNDNLLLGEITLTRRILQVPVVEQGESPVCWLASAYMLLQYHGQMSILDNVVNNPMGNFRESTVENFGQNRARYEFLRELGFQQHHLSGLARRTRVPTMAHPSRVQPAHSGQTEPHPIIDFIHSKIDSGQPMIFCHRMGTFSYGPKFSRTNNSIGYHAVVITGYDSSRQAIYFNLTWAPRGVSTSGRRENNQHVPATEQSIEASILDFEQRMGLASLLTYRP